MRALLIINPRATSISRRAVGRVAHELGSSLELDTTQTRYRGHARELAAAAGDYGLVVPLGGDGTVNEVVNGIMEGKSISSPATEAPAAGPPGGLGGGEPPAGGPPGGPAGPPPGGHGGTGSVPPWGVEGGRNAPLGNTALAPVPGGGANVFARTLGLPPDPVLAARQIATSVRAGMSRTIGLGLATGHTGERYFMFSAGLGVDAEVVADMEQIRASGQRETAPLFVWTALRRYFTTTDRRNPALTLEPEGYPPESGLFMGVVTNSSPWTYLGNHPVRPTPNTDFSSGLDVFAMRRLRTLSTLDAITQMMHREQAPVSGRDVITMTALPGLAFQASRPVAFHIDGEYLGEIEKVAFRHLPDAIRVIA